MVSRTEEIPYQDPFLAHHAECLAIAGESQLKFDEWDSSVRGAVGFDVESFVNFFVICFKRFSDGKQIAFERSARGDFDRELLLSVLRGNVLVSFNGLSYDLPMIYLALSGADTVRLKAASDRIILGNLKPWELELELGVRVPPLNHIDLMEPNPAVRQGLKIMQGRLHCRYLVDLPYSPEARLTPQQQNVVTLYCFNDIDANEVLYDALREPLKLRAALGKIYGMDLRSKSDSQVGEAIVKRRVETTLGCRVAKNIGAPAEFRYTPPDFLRFEKPQLSAILGELSDTRFHISGDKVLTPEILQDLTVTIGGSTYAMGIGGLHSTEAHRAVLSDAEHLLLDVDVASQYPNIILYLGLYPRALGPAFLQIYADLIKDRLAAKAAGDKVRADGGRIALNGVFGKLGSAYSCLYSPDLLIAVTLTGQLTILMLIERAERAGISVVSANTDGVVFRLPRGREAELDEIISAWEKDTGLSVEQTPYKALYNSSVNTYIALREDGKVKRKGVISNPWKNGDLRGQMMKNPQMTVCSDAVVSYVAEGIPIEQTIGSCLDPRAFLTVVKVTGGATWRGHALGRAVRYYWGLDGESIRYVKGSKKVSKTDGARPLQELSDELPGDIDYLRYHQEAYRLAADLGIT